MPAGAEIFETQGPWEDYATPSRDMRLLIAIDTVLDLPARVERTPDRFALPPGTSAKQAADAARTTLDQVLRARTFTYTRSDGSKHTLSLADVIARRADLELGYNPNTCPEVRWGAPEGSPERATCQRATPAAQFTRMQQYRTWFATRTRPPRAP
jgi:hypothetical protein